MRCLFAVLRVPTIALALITVAGLGSASSESLGSLLRTCYNETEHLLPYSQPTNNSLGFYEPILPFLYNSHFHWMYRQLDSQNASRERIIPAVWGSFSFDTLSWFYFDVHCRLIAPTFSSCLLPRMQQTMDEFEYEIAADRVRQISKRYCEDLTIKQDVLLDLRTLHSELVKIYNLLRSQSDLDPLVAIEGDCGTYTEIYTQLELSLRSHVNQSLLQVMSSSEQYLLDKLQCYHGSLSRHQSVSREVTELITKISALVLAMDQSDIDLATERVTVSVDDITVEESDSVHQNINTLDSSTTTRLIYTWYNYVIVFLFHSLYHS